MDEVRTLRRQGALAAAEKTSLAAVAEAQKSGLEDSRLAKSWNNLATIYYDAGHYTEAEKFFELATHLWERLYAADSVEAAWALVDPILEAWKNSPTPSFPNYAAGSRGPNEADDLVVTGGQRWCEL